MRNVIKKMRKKSNVEHRYPERPRLSDLDLNFDQLLEHLCYIDAIFPFEPSHNILNFDRCTDHLWRTVPKPLCRRKLKISTGRRNRLPRDVVQLYTSRQTMLWKKKECEMRPYLMQPYFSFIIYQYRYTYDRFGVLIEWTCHNRRSTLFLWHFFDMKSWKTDIYTSFQIFFNLPIFISIIIIDIL